MERFERATLQNPSPRAAFDNRSSVGLALAYLSGDTAAGDTLFNSRGAASNADSDRLRIRLRLAELEEIGAD